MRVTSPPPFNLNTLSRGISTADFYLAVPAAVMRFLETDTRTKLLAKPQLRGAEGTKMTVNLGTQVPVVSTSYTPIATGGAGVNPLNSFQLKDVGINIDITPRVTLDGDVLIDLNVESSAQGPDKNVAGTNYPSFVTRKVGTRLRLRDGESNLLAGLLREDDTDFTRGFPGAIHVPLLKQAFSFNSSTKSQIDLIMLLTPHIIRTNEITEDDLRPIYIGSQQNIGLGGPPPLIAVPAAPDALAAPPPPAPAPPRTPATGRARRRIRRRHRPEPRSPHRPARRRCRGWLSCRSSRNRVNRTRQADRPGQPPQPVPSPPPDGAAAIPPRRAASGGAVGSCRADAAGARTGADGGRRGRDRAGADLAARHGIPRRPGTVHGAAVDRERVTAVDDHPHVDLRPRAAAGAIGARGQPHAIGRREHDVHAQIAPGRVDMTITRAADATGATGTGLLAAIVFDAVAPGSATISLSGTGLGPGGTPMGLQFRPVTVTVQ